MRPRLPGREGGAAFGWQWGAYLASGCWTVGGGKELKADNFNNPGKRDALLHKKYAFGLILWIERDFFEDYS